MVAVYPAKYDTDNVSLLSKRTKVTSASILAEDMQYPIHIALIRNDHDQLEKLLLADEDVNTRNHRGTTALEFAIGSYTDDPNMI